MAITRVIDGVEYSIPEQGERNWGENTTDLLVALADNALLIKGGSIPLTSEADFGATAGLKALWFTSRSANAAAAGVFRLSNGETVSWRNNAADADLSLTVDASDDLLFNSSKIITVGNISTEIPNDSITTAMLQDDSVTLDKIGPDVQAAIDANDAQVAANTTEISQIRSTQGVPAGSTDLGTLAGSIVPDNSTVKVAIESVEAAHETHVGSTSEHGVTGNIVGTQGSQTLENKTLDNPRISDTGNSIDTVGAAILKVGDVNATSVEVGRSGQTTVVKGDLQVDGTTTTVIADSANLTELASTPATPVAGIKKLYPKTDGKLYTLNSAGVEVEVGSGASGTGPSKENAVINSDFEEDITNWSATGDATLAAETVSPLSGTTSLRITNTFSTTRFNVRGSMSVPSENFRALTQTKSAFIKITGTGKYKVRIYDNTSAAVHSEEIEVIGSAAGNLSPVIFRNGNIFDTNTYFFEIIDDGDGVNGDVILVDQVKVEQGEAPLGAVISDWQPYAVTSIQGWGTVTSNLEWKQSGTSYFIRGDVTLGTVAASEIQIPLPNGVTVKAASGSHILAGQLRRSAATAQIHNIIVQNGDTFLNVGLGDGGNNPMTPANGNIFISSERVSFECQFEADGVGGTLETLSQANAKNAAFAAISRNEFVANGGGIIQWSNNTQFNVGGGTFSGGQYIVPATGFYLVNYSIRANSNISSFETRILVNGVEQASAFDLSATVSQQSRVVYAEAGQTIRIENHSASGITSLNVANYSFLSITRHAQITGVTVGLPTDDQIADFEQFLIGKKREFTTTLDNGFDGGTVNVRLDGDRVDLSLRDVSWAGNVTGVSSSVGLLPEWARPSGNLLPVFGVSTSRLIRLEISTSGRLNLTFYNNAFVTSNTLDTQVITDFDYRYKV